MVVLTILLAIGCAFNLNGAEQDASVRMLHLLRAQRYGDAATYCAASACLPEALLPDRVTYYGTVLIKKIPVLYWQMLFLFCWYLLCWCLFAKQHCLRIKKRLLMLLLLILSVPIMIGYCTDNRKVFIIAQAVPLYNGPNSSFYTIGTLESNTVALVLDTKKDWYKVKQGVQIGWIEQQAASEI